MRAARRNAVFLEIALVVFLGPPEIGRRSNLRHNLAREAARAVEFVFNFVRGAFLLGIMKENYGAVLFAVVGPLSRAPDGSESSGHVGRRKPAAVARMKFAGDHSRAAQLQHGRCDHCTHPRK
jgi:hypothetical protein